MKRIKQLVPLMIIAVMIAAPSCAQKRTSPKASAENSVGNLKINMVYHQPAVDGRSIYGDLVPYDKVWRTGANDATTFEISQDATINGKKLAKGTYSLFTIPGKGEWTVIFNSVSKQWGAYDYDKAKDVLRVTVKPKKEKSSVERMTFDVSAKGQVTYSWENLSFTLDVKAN